MDLDDKSVIADLSLPLAHSTIFSTDLLMKHHKTYGLSQIFVFVGIMQNFVIIGYCDKKNHPTNLNTYIYVINGFPNKFDAFLGILYSLTQ